MANLAATLKDEIRRLARREIKAETFKTKRAVAQYRREIARLKRQVTLQDRKMASLLEQARGSQSAAPEATETEDKSRFSARSVKAQRKRLKLSAEEYARLVGVSPLTIYSWEHGRSRPRKAQFESLVSLRNIGRREALARLQAAKPAKQNAAGRRKPGRRKSS